MALTVAKSLSPVIPAFGKVNLPPHPPPPRPRRRGGFLYFLRQVCFIIRPRKPAVPGRRVGQSRRGFGGRSDIDRRIWPL